MILITPDDGPDSLSDSITSVERQLADLRGELDRIYDRLQSGDLDDLQAAGKSISEVRQWLKLAIDAEIYLEKRTKQKRGIVHDYAVNLEEAKLEIRGKLDRLMRDEKKQVSEEPG